MRSYNKPDLKAPRYRKKTHSILNKSFYDRIREKGDAYKSLTDKEIKNIITNYNDKIWKTVIEKRDGVELLDQLGYIFVGTCNRHKSKNIDTKKSIELGVEVQHQNWESDQYLAKIFYTNFETKYRFMFHELWGFTATRNFKRTLSSVYPKEWKKYVVVDNMVKISKLFRKHILNHKDEENAKVALETYDEFDMT